MSIRNALTWSVLGISLLGTVVLAVLGTQRIRRGVWEVAQDRVDHDLRMLESDYARRLDAFAARFGDETSGLDPADPALGERLRGSVSRLDLSVLAVVTPDGRRLAGPLAAGIPALEVERDPIVRRALAGRPAWGTVRLDAERLRAEGGEALERSVTLRHGEDVEVDGLAWWVAVPLLDARGRVVAVAYGGRLLNHDLALVDELAAVVEGGRAYKGKPLTTVTLFLGPTRATTNVVDGAGRRALGTRVSAEVAERVLGEGRRWSDRARVVDTWYLSGYAPLRDPDRTLVGMLYVGLLEAPFDDAMRRQLQEFLLWTSAVALLALAALLWMVRRITRPLERLGTAAEAFGRGEWEHEVELPRTYTEIGRLADTLEGMRHAIARRDASIRRRTEELAETNEKLERVNRNYMETLGFVTHELKAPLAAIQMMSQLLDDRFAEDLPEEGRKLLSRVQRNSEELQGMVKDYLDLSRAERGELEASPADIDLRADVLEPAAAQAEPLLRSRGMRFELEAPAEIPLHADAELLRIAVTNLLSNAAKYGAADGAVRLEASAADEHVRLEVFNEGPGFDEAEAARLFGRFARLRNANTRDKRGSGLGLYLVRRIVEQHGGAAQATSEPGAWARFTLQLPAPSASRSEP